MKNFTFVFLFASLSAGAGNCDLISGSFRTTTAPCYIIQNGAERPDDSQKMRIAYNDVTKKLDITMVSHNYTLNYKADGNVQMGRPMFEGDRYTALCETNHIHVRAEMSLLKYPYLQDYTLSGADRMTYKESYEGDDSFVRICEMERFK